jgi:hypothetical protein
VTEYRSWPAPVRTLARAIDDAVSAAVADRPDEFTDALGRLARIEPSLLAGVLGDVAAALLEQAYPDGLDAADAEQLLRRCVGRFDWCPVLDEEALVHALAGTLGVSLEEESLRPAALPNGLLLVAELVGDRPVAPVVDGALRELQLRQSAELP